MNFEQRQDSIKGEIPLTIILRPITADDQEFLFQLYASTRAEEKELVGWDDEQWEQFLRMQFDLQHTQYMQNYRNATFDIIMVGQTPAGSLYVDRQLCEIRIIGICLLPEHRGRGIGAGLIRNILCEGGGGGIPVTLHVQKDNPALSLYQRLGFCIEADRGVCWFMGYSSSGAASPDFEPKSADNPV